MDDKTVKCFLSNEELEQYHIDYKDFVMRNEKAKEVVQEIIVQAEEEVGYKPPKFAFDLQIMVIPEEGLLLTFSEKEPDGEQLMECLREMRAALQQARETIGASGQPQQREEKTSQKQKTQLPEFAAFTFLRLRDVLDYAAVLPGNLRVESELHELQGVYYLILKKGHASYQRYSRACIQAMEFACLYSAEENRLQVLKEYGTCLIAEKAVRKLRG